MEFKIDLQLFEETQKPSDFRKSDLSIFQTVPKTGYECDQLLMKVEAFEEHLELLGDSRISNNGFVCKKETRQKKKSREKPQIVLNYQKLVKTS